jgi:cell division GTPase FtsZ
MADQVLCSGVACITDLMVKERLVNLDFADVCSIMSEMGTAMIGTGEAMANSATARWQSGDCQSSAGDTDNPAQTVRDGAVPCDRLIAG